jgi:hypothetical protein
MPKKLVEAFGVEEVIDPLMDIFGSITKGLLGPIGVIGELHCFT